jgi:cell division transport system permease protein
MRTSNSKSSIIYAILSNTIVLVLIGFFALIYFHTNSITNLVREQINILIEINPESNASAKDEIIGALKQTNGVLKNSIRFIPKENAAEVLGNQLTFDSIGLTSAFKDIVSFNLSAQAYSEERLRTIKEQFMKVPSVFDVFYEHVVVENIKSNLNKVSYAVLILSLIFVFLAVVIIYNTINLSLYADRWEIKTMEIIGARDGFIRQPYLKIAARIALISFAIASILILLVLAIIYFNFEDVKYILKWYYFILSLAIIFVISLFITIFATITIVNKYLYKKESELY